MMKPVLVAGILVSSLLFARPAASAEINVLSGGAIEPGLHAVADAFKKQTGNEVKVRFATTPAILKRVGEGEIADVVIAPPAAIDELAKSGKLDGQVRAPVGRVGVGVVVRQGAPVPDIATTDAFKRAMLDAESIVYNQASTGLYLERLFQRLALADDLKARTKRYPDGDAVMQHLIKGTGKEIGFGAMTEILLFSDRGLRLVGPLPADIQNYTAYIAAPHAGAANPSGSRAFLEFLGKPEAKQLFAAKGIE
jgi:molybdate transport system substrate-binding protein